MKKIIIYYSLEGNTKYVAELLNKKLNCDILELKPIKKYHTKGFLKFF